ncbi:pyocin activator PrtN family protein [Pseudomonas sp. EL_65y_Pfl2_R96]|uniref:pyocin activator PrtN family protein n=1 Tax=Pseudomonas sp. EL_65y_Pfl2_R96 TaxID=3088699 RepID=UPI0030DAF1ED
MSNTLDQLRRQFATPCPSLTAVREHYFTHIRTDRYLLSEIKAGRIQLVVTRLHNSARAKPVVYLHNLAAYLDAQAAKQAA